MTDKYIVKIQTEQTGEQVLVYSENRDIHVIIGGPDAKTIIDGYDLDPQERIFAEAEVDENGFMSLGNQLEEQWW